MCSPEVAKVVSERVRREGRPTVSRRSFLRIGGLTAGVALAPGLLRPSRARVQEMAQVVDLSHVFATQLPTYLPDLFPTRQDRVTVAANGFYIQDWTFSEHTGTHMDIPAHFVEDGETVDNYPVELYVSPAVVIDIAARAEDDPDTMVSVDDLAAWESANGEIPLGALVCMYSGWESRWSDIAKFRNPDDEGVMHFPGFSGDAAKFLIEERDIHGIAVDTLSLDNGPSSTFDVHFTILGAGKYGLENVANLATIKDGQATVVIGVPRWENGSGGPCRVMAMLAAM